MQLVMESEEFSSYYEELNKERLEAMYANRITFDKNCSIQFVCYCLNFTIKYLVLDAF